MRFMTISMAHTDSGGPGQTESASRLAAASGQTGGVFKAAAAGTYMSNTDEAKLAAAVTHANKTGTGRGTDGSI